MQEKPIHAAVPSLEFPAGHELAVDAVSAVRKTHQSRSATRSAYVRPRDLFWLSSFVSNGTLVIVYGTFLAVQLVRFVSLGFVDQFGISVPISFEPSQLNLGILMRLAAGTVWF